VDTVQRDNIDDHLCPIEMEPLVQAVKLDCGNGHLVNESAAKALFAHARDNYMPILCPLCRGNITKYTVDRNERDLVARIQRQQNHNLPANQQQVGAQAHKSQRQNHPRPPQAERQRDQRQAPAAQSRSWNAPAGSAFVSMHLKKIQGGYDLSLKFAPMSDVARQCILSAGLKMGKDHGKMRDGNFSTKNVNRQLLLLRLAFEQHIISQRDFNDLSNQVQRG
jgi:hypothetical protein